MPRGAEGHAAGSPRLALTPRARGSLAVLAGVALAGWLWSLHIAASGEATGLFHDGGVYLVTARALAEDAGYRTTSLPGSPPAVRYPPLFPLALSAVWRLAPRFPDNLPLLKGVPLLAALGLVLVLPGALRATGVSATVAVATALLTAAAPLTMRYATAIAAELPFALLALLALWCVERSIRPDAGPGTAATGGMLAGCAFLTRSVGIAVIGAGCVSLLRRADGRRARAFALAAAPFVLGWAAWLFAQRGRPGSPGYLASLLHDGIPGPGDLLGHVIALPAAVGLVTVPGLSDLLPAVVPWSVLLVVYACGAVALAAGLRGAFGPYVALTVAIAVAVPWFQPRFLVPLAPLFLAASFTTLCPDGASDVRRRLTATVVVAFIALGLAGNQVRLASVRTSGIPALEEGTYPGGRWEDLQDTFTWLSAHTAPDDVLASFDDPMLYLYTGRTTVQAYPSLWRPDPEQVTAALDGTGARYLVDVPTPDSGTWADAHHAWHDWLATYARTLELVHETPGGIRIFRRAARP